jgi:hypothetical protein
MPPSPVRLWSAPPDTARGRRPLTYSIDGALGVIFIDLHAIDDAPSVVKALQQIRLNPLFTRRLSAWVDCRYVNAAPTTDEIRALAELWPRSAARDLTGRCAIIASSAWAHRAAQTCVALSHVRSSRVRVFNACAHALVWLSAGKKPQERRGLASSPRFGVAPTDDPASLK